MKETNTKSTPRNQAKAQGLKHYHGKPCSKHPELEGKRFVSNRQCCGCLKDRSSTDETKAARRKNTKKRTEIGTLNGCHLYSLKLTPCNEDGQPNGLPPIWKVGITTNPHHRCCCLMSATASCYILDEKPSLTTYQKHDGYTVATIRIPMQLKHYPTTGQAAAIEASLKRYLKDYQAQSLCSFAGDTELFNVDPFESLSELT